MVADVKDKASIQIIRAELKDQNTMAIWQISGPLGGGIYLVILISVLVVRAYVPNNPVLWV